MPSELDMPGVRLFLKKCEKHFGKRGERVESKDILRVQSLRKRLLEGSLTEDRRLQATYYELMARCDRLLELVNPEAQMETDELREMYPLL